MNRTRLALCLALGTAGCAYYNSMYNAVHLAAAAERAERQGRTFDAQADWAQVATKAETTLARHPTSKWALPARFLQGKAYQRLNSCERAIGPLELVRSESRDTATIAEARALLGDCYTRLGDPAAAGAAYQALLTSSDSAVRHRALYAVGVADLAAGRPTDAMKHLLASGDPRATGLRVVALARSGRPEHAAALADTLLDRGDSTVAWDSIFAAVGTAAPALGSALVDRRAAFPGVTPAEKGNWFAADAQRLLALDTARAFRRYAEVDSISPGSEAARQGAVARADVWVARATSAAALDSAIGYLDAFARTSNSAAYQVGGELSAVRWLSGELDSLAPAVPPGDIRTFLAAEFARDSVGALRLAGILFRRVAVEAPVSAYAPKALLALAALDPRAADSIAQVLHATYAASPYLAALGGATPAAYAVLEDSLRAFAEAHPHARRVRPSKRDPREQL